MDGLAATRSILSSWPSGERPWIAALTAAMKENRDECHMAGNGRLSDQAYKYA
jgi:hypothetical protein